MAEILIDIAVPAALPDTTHILSQRITTSEAKSLQVGLLAIRCRISFPRAQLVLELQGTGGLHRDCA